MNRDKQTEEIANEIYETLMLEAECPLSGMDCAIIADLLVNKGYRKASELEAEIEDLKVIAEQYQKQFEDARADVAREIFEEIETILDRHSISYLKVGQICGEHYYDGVMQFDIAELKKKYTEVKDV